MDSYSNKINRIKFTIDEIREDINRFFNGKSAKNVI